jgi:hypothetical protein
MWVLYVTSFVSPPFWFLKFGDDFVFLGSVWTLVMYAIAVADTMNQKGTDAPELLRCTFPSFQNF